MADFRGSAESASILEPQDAQRIRQAGPDLGDWPRSWQVEPADIIVGQQIVRVFTPFLLHLLDQGLTKATVRRHRDKLWRLGGELIRCRCDDDARQDVRDAIRQLTERDSGPLMWPRITKSEQGALDATCRKLNRFMSESAAADSTA